MSMRLFKKTKDLLIKGKGKQKLLHVDTLFVFVIIWDNNAEPNNSSK